MTTTRTNARPVSLEVTRRVWAAVTASPQASYRELAETVGVHSTYTVQCAMRKLRDAGYIEFTPRHWRARRILVPFVGVR